MQVAEAMSPRANLHSEPIGHSETSQPVAVAVTQVSEGVRVQEKVGHTMATGGGSGSVGLPEGSVPSEGFGGTSVGSAGGLASVDGSVGAVSEGVEDTWTLRKRATNKKESLDIFIMVRNWNGIMIFSPIVVYWESLGF